MASVFISYKRENKGAVQAIVQGLRSSGLTVWWDQDIAPDAPWEATIERELEQAKVVLVAWSRAAAASENVKAEARRARTQGKLIQVFVEGCDPPLFFGERQGVDLIGWNGDIGDNRFKAVTTAAKAILSGRKPPAGVGYAPRKKSPVPLLLGVGVIAIAATAALNLERVRASACSVADLGSWCVASASLAAEAAPASSAAQEQTAAPRVEQPVTARLEGGASRRLEVVSGAAIDFDAALSSDRLTDGSDFVLSGDAVGYAIAAVAPPAAVGVAVSGTPTPAACGLEIARPEITWQIPLANDVGEYQCFITSDGRAGAFVLQRGRAGLSGVVISYTLWDD